MLLFLLEVYLYFYVYERDVFFPPIFNGVLPSLGCVFTTYKYIFIFCLQHKTSILRAQHNNFKLHTITRGQKWRFSEKRSAWNWKKKKRKEKVFEKKLLWVKRLIDKEAFFFLSSFVWEHNNEGERTWFPHSRHSCDIDKIPSEARKPKISDKTIKTKT